jgi:hypothetical protein
VTSLQQFCKNCYLLVAGLMLNCPSYTREINTILPLCSHFSSNRTSYTSTVQSVSQSPALQRASLVSIPGHFLWDLWWIKWHCNNIFPGYIHFTLSVSFHQSSIRYPFTYLLPKKYNLTTWQSFYATNVTLCMTVCAHVPLSSRVKLLGICLC